MTPPLAIPHHSYDDNPRQRPDVPLIGLIGLKRSGKDTAAQGLIQDGWTRMAFADPLKEMSQKLRGVWVQVPAGVELDAVVPSVGGGLIGRGGGFAQYHYVVDALGMEKVKELIPDVRTLLQTLGTDCVRGTFGSTAWVDITKRKVREALSRGESVVLTDVRFDEEFDLVQLLGGVTIGVWRGDFDSLCDVLDDEADLVGGDAHESETNVYHLLDRCDYIACNNGSVDELHRGVRSILDYERSLMV